MPINAEDISAIFAKAPHSLTHRDILSLLRTPWLRLAPLARSVADAAKGRRVFVRGLLEFANICRRNCHYCGLRRQNMAAKRYCLSREQIIAAASQAKASGVDTIVLQSGEGSCSSAWLAETVRAVKKRTGLPVTLSVGEHNDADYALWRDAGADRYLIKHETADPELYAALHPGHNLAERVAAIKTLQAMGYETGGGFMVGLPGQTLDTLARDILLCRDLRLAMVGVGPFIAQRNTPLARATSGTAELTLRVIAALRLALPNANLPATTALASIDPEGGQANGLLAGANVLMPSFTPPERAADYVIYDHKNRVSAVNAAQVIESVGMSHRLHLSP